MSNGVRILHFRAENVKRLEVVDFEPDRQVNVVAGENGAGKSAVLDSILYAIAGKKALPSEPVRRGTEQAKITLDLGDFIVERRITAAGRDYLTIKTREGLTFSSPQRMLNELVDQIAFDPAEWLRKKPSAQRGELLSIAPLKISVDGNRADRKAAYAERQLLGRDLKRLTGAVDQVGTLPDLPKVRPLEEVWEEHKAAQEVLKTRQEHAAAVNGLTKVVQEAKDELARYKAAFERGLDKRQTAIRLAEAELLAKQDMGLPDLPDMEAIEEEFRQAQNAVNLKQKYDHLYQMRRERKAVQARYDALTEKLADLDAELKEALQEADMPVEGLSVGEDEVYFNGLPLNQASQAEQLRVALAVAARIQAKKEAKLRIVRIMDGSLLDDSSMALVRRFAEEQDFQLWIERIERDGATIVIEDGTLAGAPAGKNESGRVGHLQHPDGTPCNDPDHHEGCPPLERDHLEEDFEDLDF